MFARVEITNPGIHCSIQDYGRVGGLDYGVSESGVMDIFAYDHANSIVGNHPGVPALEILGGSFKALIHDPVVICVTGAMAEMKINSVHASLWESYLLKKGDQLELSSLQVGIRNYLAINGNWLELDKFLDSYSTDEKAKIGGWSGRALKSGDVLKIDGSSRPVKKRLTNFEDPYFKQMTSKQKEVRVLLGPQDEAFGPGEIEVFFSNDYEMTTKSNRMGLRLKGVALEHLDSPDILSDAIPFGAIQIPGDGQPIIMMADRQTTGGYTKIGTVVSTDLPILAQTRPGDTIRFKRIHFHELNSIDQERANRNHIIQQKKEEHAILSSKHFSVYVENKHYKLLVEELESIK